MTGNQPRILRPGAVTEEQIREVLGRAVSGFAPTRDAKAGQVIIAPGLLDRHYSPSTPLRLRSEPFGPGELEALPSERGSPLFPKARIAGDRVFWLSEDGNKEAVARRLFSVLRELDQKGFGAIEVEPAPSNEGLGCAINDRLRRAAGKG